MKNKFILSLWLVSSIIASPSSPADAGPSMSSSARSPLSGFSGGGVMAELARRKAELDAKREERVADEAVERAAAIERIKKLRLHAKETSDLRASNNLWMEAMDLQKKHDISNKEVMDSPTTGVISTDAYKRMSVDERADAIDRVDAGSRSKIDVSLRADAAKAYMSPHPSEDPARVRGKFGLSGGVLSPKVKRIRDEIQEIDAKITILNRKLVKTPEDRIRLITLNTEKQNLIRSLD